MGDRIWSYQSCPDLGEGNCTLIFKNTELKWIFIVQYSNLIWTRYNLTMPQSAQNYCRFWGGNSHNIGVWRISAKLKPQHIEKAAESNSTQKWFSHVAITPHWNPPLLIHHASNSSSLSCKTTLWGSTDLASILNLLPLWCIHQVHASLSEWQCAQLGVQESNANFIKSAWKAVIHHIGQHSDHRSIQTPGRTEWWDPHSVISSNHLVDKKKANTT